MKIAIIGSRGLSVSMSVLKQILPDNITEIVSGGANGIDKCARQYADENYIPINEILPEYDIYGKSAPIKRNLLIIDEVQAVFAFWDGKSRGTMYVINTCKKKNVPCRVFLFKDKKYTEIE